MVMLENSVFPQTFQYDLDPKLCFAMGTIFPFLPNSLKNVMWAIISYFLLERRGSLNSKTKVLITING